MGHTDSHETGVENLPLSLHQAMARLGRHYFESGQEDRAASVHQLLRLCTQPLRQWAPLAVAALDLYQDAILIDDRYLVPNEECETIAESIEGVHLGDLIERHLHERLRSILATLGEDADRTYTAIREFVGRHPLVTNAEWQAFARNPELSDEAIAFVNALYTPIHADYAREGQVQCCAHCHGLLTPSDGCLLAGCRDDFPATAAGAAIPRAKARLARPEVLKYWADPAREELRVYDTLRAIPRLRDETLLYPHSDWCDIALGDEVGIDVKDYRDPVRLAQRLNRSIGHLERYPVRILAVARRRWTKLYRDQLQEHLAPQTRSLLRVMSVDDAIRFLRRYRRVPSPIPRA